MGERGRGVQNGRFARQGRPMGLDRKSIDLAARQGGYVARAQLQRKGMSDKAIDWRVQTGELEVVSDGVYRVFHSTDHTDLLRGAILTLPDAIVSHQSAAHLLELPRLPTLEPTVTVASRTTHHFPEVNVRRCDDVHPTHVTQTAGLPVTTVARTLFDLSGILEYRKFDEIAEAAVLGSRVELRHLQRISDELSRRGKRGSSAMKTFLEQRLGQDAGATPLERRGRRVLVAGGLPLPVAQLPIPWSPNRRFDDAYPAARLAIEWDSRAWHLQRAAMESDRKRDRLAATKGWVVLRFTSQDLKDQPEEVVATVSKLLDGRLPRPRE